MRNYKKIKRNGGQAMLILVVFFLFISLAIITGLVSPSVRQFKVASDFIYSRQSFFLSESGIEDAYYRLKNAKPIGDSVALSLDGNIVTTNITDSGFNEKTITSSGDVFNRERKNEVVLSTGQGVSFNYGIQAGQGGFTMLNNAGVNGNVYSNGNIGGGSNGSFISGTAIAAGVNGTINRVTIGQSGIGNAWAHTISNSNVAGNLLCQTGSGNNKTCDTSQPDPEPIPMPITQEMIDQWKADAEVGGIVEGNLIISEATSLGPKKITGNLTINADLTVTDTIYVVGRIITANNVHVSLSPSYGASSGILLTDGPIDLSNNVIFEGSGTGNTFVMLITTSSCPSGCGGTNALEIANNAGAVILNAQNGTAHLNNNVTLNEIVAEEISMDPNAVVDYLTGLANVSFTSGPSGGWNIKSWKEVI